MTSTIERALSTIALLYIIKKIWDVIYTYFLGPVINKVDIKSYGKWAMVTGSTDGIGKEYTRQLAARGCDIILVSRSMEKLRKVAKELEDEFKVQTKVIQIDFTEGLSIYDKLAKEIQGLEIGTLVNNVGMSKPYPEYFLDIPDWNNFMTNLIAVNIVSMIRVTGIVLPEMVKRRKGIVINMGSISGIVCCPMISTYGGTKAFVGQFTDGLKLEYYKKGILFQCVAPGVVSTNLSKIETPSFFIPDTKSYVTSALSLLGTTSNTYGYFNHAINAFIFDSVRAISEKLYITFTAKIFEQNRDVLRKIYERNRQE